MQHKLAQNLLCSKRRTPTLTRNIPFSSRCYTFCINGGKRVYSKSMPIKTQSVFKTVEAPWLLHFPYWSEYVVPPHGFKFPKLVDYFYLILCYSIMCKELHVGFEPTRRVNLDCLQGSYRRPLG